MKSRNGTDYAQNYDIIVKLMAGALKGETLEVIGVRTGRITDVFGFEPVDISVRAGRLDVILKDENNAYYHFEEQRNLSAEDMHRFGAYHFMGAGQWPNLTDIILASGNSSFREKKIETPSGRYEPVIVDFSRRDGKRRLKEIRSELEEGRFGNLLELVFLPLYGKETGEERSEMVKEIIRFQTGLFHKKIISAELLAAVMVISNKMVDRGFLEKIWEEVKMLDIIDFAREKGMEEGIRKGKDLGLKVGKDLGLKEGKDLGILEGRHIGRMEGLMDAIEMGLHLKFGVSGLRLLPAVQEITDIRRLEMIRKIITATDDLSAIEAALN